MIFVIQVDAAGSVEKYFVVIFGRSYCTGLNCLKGDLVGMLHFNNNLIHAKKNSHILHIVNKQLVDGGVILNNAPLRHQRLAGAPQDWRDLWESTKRHTV